VNWPQFRCATLDDAKAIDRNFQTRSLSAPRVKNQNTGRFGNRKLVHRNLRRLTIISPSGSGTQPKGVTFPTRCRGAPKWRNRAEAEELFGEERMQFGENHPHPHVPFKVVGILVAKERRPAGRTRMTYHRAFHNGDQTVDRQTTACAASTSRGQNCKYCPC